MEITGATRISFWKESVQENTCKSFGEEDEILRIYSERDKKKDIDKIIHIKI